MRGGSVYKPQLEALSAVLDTERQHELAVIELESVKEQLHEAQQRIRALEEALSGGLEAQLSQAKTSLLNLEKDMLSKNHRAELLYKERYEAGIGTPEAEAIAKQELNLQRELDRVAQELRKRKFSIEKLETLGQRYSQDLRREQAALPTLRERSDVLEARVHELGHQLHVAGKMVSEMFNLFGSIDSDDLISKLHLESHAEEVRNWVKKELPSFSGSIRAAIDELDKIRVRMVTRYGPLGLQLEMLGIDVVTLTQVLTERVHPIFDTQLAKHFVSSLSPQALSDLVINLQTKQ